MIITCPECKTNYRASAKAIGPNGRTVRCANCASTWFVPAEQAELTLDKLALQDIERDEGRAFAQESKVKTSLQQSLAGQSKIKESLAPKGLRADDSQAVNQAWTGKEEAKPEPKPGAHTAMRDRTDRKSSRRRFWNVMLIWLIPLILLSAAALAAYIYRQNIVDKFPKSASIYKAVGVEVSAPGLTLTPPTTRYAEIDGKPVLVVEGTVRNISNEGRDIPMVALSLHNSSGEELAAWNVELESKRLNAGARADYISQYPNPPLDAVGLQSRFADDMEITRTPIELTAPTPQE